MPDLSLPQLIYHPVFHALVLHLEQHFPDALDQCFHNAEGDGRQLTRLFKDRQALQTFLSTNNDRSYRVDQTALLCVLLVEEYIRRLRDTRLGQLEDWLMPRLQSGLQAVKERVKKGESFVDAFTEESRVTGLLLSANQQAFAPYVAAWLRDDRDFENKALLDVYQAPSVDFKQCFYRFGLENYYQALAQPEAPLVVEDFAPLFELFKVKAVVKHRPQAGEELTTLLGEDDGAELTLVINEQGEYRLPVGGSDSLREYRRHAARYQLKQGVLQSMDTRDQRLDQAKAWHVGLIYEVAREANLGAPKQALDFMFEELRCLTFDQETAERFDKIKLVFGENEKDLVTATRRQLRALFLQEREEDLTRPVLKTWMAISSSAELLSLRQTYYNDVGDIVVLNKAYPEYYQQFLANTQRLIIRRNETSKLVDEEALNGALDTIKQCATLNEAEKVLLFAGIDTLLESLAQARDKSSDFEKLATKLADVAASLHKEEPSGFGHFFSKRCPEALKPVHDSLKALVLMMARAYPIEAKLMRSALPFARQSWQNKGAGVLACYVTNITALERIASSIRPLLTNSNVKLTHDSSGLPGLYELTLSGVNLQSLEALEKAHQRLAMRQPGQSAGYRVTR